MRSQQRDNTEEIAASEILVIFQSKQNLYHVHNQVTVEQSAQCPVPSFFTIIARHDSARTAPHVLLASSQRRLFHVCILYKILHVQACNANSEVIVKPRVKRHNIC